MDLSKQNRLANKLNKKSNQLYKLYKNGASLRSIGLKYGVARTTIGRIFKKNNLEIRDSSNSHKIIYSLSVQNKIKKMSKTETLTAISQKLKLGKTGLKTYMRDNQLRKFKNINTQGPDKRLLKKIENNLEFHYKDLINTPKTLKTKSNELKVTTNILRRRFTNAGYKLRNLSEEQLVFQKLKRDLNYDFFKVRTPESNYWVGFIAADGAIIDLKKDINKKLRLSITIDRKDQKHLNKLKILLRGGRISTWDFSKYNNKHKSKKVKNIIKGSISSKYQLDNTLICRDLVKLGVTPRKSHSFKPHKSLLYSNDFWRGIIDGDGNLTNLDKTRSTNLMLGSGSINEIKSFKKYLLKSKIKIRTTQIRKGEYSNDFYIITLSGNRARKLAKLIYEDSPKIARLERKYKIYLQWKKRKGN